jgi:hypothetical protein
MNDPQTPEGGRWEEAARYDGFRLSEPSDSIRAPIEKRFARIEFNPVPITELGESVPPPFIWDGYIAPGYITLLTALWKAGKTTLLSHLIRDLQRGGGLVGPASGIKILVVSEEAAGLWTKRRDLLDLGASLHIARRPFRAKPSVADWIAFVGMVVERVKSEEYGLVIFDTLPSLWPVQDENNASEVGAALMPLWGIVEQGAALLLVHHPRKGDANEGQASRGSGALPGMVDVIMEMRRFAPTDAGDRRRVIRAYGRFDDTPPEAVVEFVEGVGYRSAGSKAEVGQADRMTIIDDVLAGAEAGRTAEEVLDVWPGDHKPGQRTIDGDLKKGFEEGRWERTGTGRKGAAYRYGRVGFDSRKPTLLEARNESDPESGAPDPPFKGGEP